MSQYKVWLTLYPGIHNAPLCSMWVERRGERVLTENTSTPTIPLGADEAAKTAIEVSAAESADRILGDAGFARTGSWERFAYALTAGARKA